MNAPAKHPKSPCSSCPYRKDAPLGHWDASHFHDVLASDGNQFGNFFSCHKTHTLPPEKRGLCAGWLNDQVQRGTPNIRLRLAVMSDMPGIKEAHRAVTDGGHEVYPSARVMCDANLAAIDRMKDVRLIEARAKAQRTNKRRRRG